MEVKLGQQVLQRGILGKLLLRCSRKRRREDIILAGPYHPLRKILPHILIVNDHKAAHLRVCEQKGRDFDAALTGVMPLVGFKFGGKLR